MSLRKNVTRLGLSFSILALILCALPAWGKGPTEKSAPPNQTNQKYQIQNGRKVGSLDRVTAKLEVGGDLIFSTGDKIDRAKMSVVGQIVYDEKTLETSPDFAGKTVAARYYHNADAVIKVEKEGKKPVLRDQRHLIGAVVDGNRRTLFSPEGPLTREELELIDLQANSLLLDRLLPKGKIGVGETWKPTNALLATLLGVDEVQTSDVQCQLANVDAQSFLFEMQGEVDGLVAGIMTQIELKAKYRFLKKRNRIDWLGMLIKETRDVGHVGSGLDVVAKLDLKVAPLANSESLSDALLAEIDWNPDPEATPLCFEPKKGQWRFLHDQAWHQTGSSDQVGVLRMIDQGELIAQCNVTTLPQVDAGKIVSLEAYQEEIKKTLGDQFGQFVYAGQKANDHDYRVMQVTVDGTVSEIPIRWHYYLIANKHGQQVAFTFTVEQDLVERMGPADRPLIETFEFVEPEVSLKEEKTAKK